MTTRSCTIFGNILCELSFQICFLVQRKEQESRGKGGIEREKKNHFFIMVAWVAMFRCYLNSDSRVELFGQISCTL